MSQNPLSDALDHLSSDKSPASPQVIERAQQLLHHIDDKKKTEHQKKADDPGNDDQGRTNLRTPLEAMSSSAEDVNVANNIERLRFLYPKADASRDEAQRDIARLLAHGESGSYVTRTPTLLQRVRALR